MISMSVGWYIGYLLGGGALCYVVGYLCGRVDGKVR